MSAANPELPDIPVELDNALWSEMLNAVGEGLAMPATDAAWRAIHRTYVALECRDTRSQVINRMLEEPA